MLERRLKVGVARLESAGLTIPAVGIVLTGTKADMRPGRNISSPVTGWITASLTRFASHNSWSVTPAASPRAWRARRSCAACSSSFDVSRVFGSTIWRKCCRRPENVDWSKRVPRGSNGGMVSSAIAAVAQRVGATEIFFKVPSASNLLV